jgi:hypothetical protein
LKKLAGIIKVVRENAKYFPVKVRPECEHAFYRYAISGNNPISRMLSHAPKTFMDIFNHKHHYITPLNQLPLFKSLGYDQHSCPVCEDVDENIILAWLKEGV